MMAWANELNCKGWSWKDLKTILCEVGRQHPPRRQRPWR
jgi:hypothetical protein